VKGVKFLNSESVRKSPKPIIFGIGENRVQSTERQVLGQALNGIAGWQVIGDPELFPHRCTQVSNCMILKAWIKTGNPALRLFSASVTD
jgi:hypothetical protein